MGMARSNVDFAFIFAKKSLLQQPSNNVGGGKGSGGLGDSDHRIAAMIVDFITRSFAKMRSAMQSKRDSCCKPSFDAGGPNAWVGGAWRALGELFDHKMDLQRSKQDIGKSSGGWSRSVQRARGHGGLTGMAKDSVGFAFIFANKSLLRQPRNKMGGGKGSGGLGNSNHPVAAMIVIDKLLV